jgi:hypothetical protein
MFKVRGMPLSTLCQAAWVGLRKIPKPRYVFLCVADHFEPDWRGAPRNRQVDRVQRWVNEYGGLFCEFEDSRGRTPQHTFFYPIEVYDEQHIDQLSKLVWDGHGDIEIHLHHDNDCSSRLTDLLEHYRFVLHDRHGLLSKDAQGQIRYGFIHGNWSLDNSHPEGNYCGVNDELTVLMRTGCYADLTMPAAPHAAQTRTINQIYYAVDDPLQPKSHDVGVAAKVGSPPPNESLLLIQGPLLLSMDRSSVFPRIRLENGNLSSGQPPTLARVQNWLRAGVSVSGCQDWLFIKLHTHGAQEENMKVVLGEPMRQMHRNIRELSKSNGFQYFYVTARELAQLVHQAESGMKSVDIDSLGW